MSISNSQYPQMTYKQAVEHCKYWADQIRADGLDLLTTDWGTAVVVRRAEIVAIYTKARTYFECKKLSRTSSVLSTLRTRAPALPTRKTLWIIFLKFSPPIFLFFS